MPRGSSDSSEQERPRTSVLCRNGSPRERRSQAPQQFGQLFLFCGVEDVAQKGGGLLLGDLDGILVELGTDIGHAHE